MRREDGFTLIEVLVALTMSLVIFAGALTILVVAVDGQAASQERNDAQDQARLAIDLITRQLRNIASPITTPKLIERADAYDLVFQTVGTPSGSNTTGAERVRYCVPADTASGNTSDEAMIGQVQTWTTATAPASIPWSTTACPDTNPSDGSSATAKYTMVAPYLMNRYEGVNNTPAWSYEDDTGATPSDLSDITTVDFDLLVNPTPTTPLAQAELRSGVYLRNQLRNPVSNFTPTDNDDGGVLLNGGTSYSPDGESLTYAWSCTSAVCPNSSTLTNASSALVSWSPGAGTYTVQLTVTDPSGLSDTYSDSITVT